MTTYHYRAKNSLGETFDGEIENESFTEAVREIQGRGLELVSIEEVKEQLKELGQFIFDAIDRRGEPVKGTIQGESEQQVRKMLQEEFGYQVTEIKRKLDPVDPRGYLERPEAVTAAAPETASEPESEEEEGIVFSHKPRAVHKRSQVISDDDLNEARQDLEALLQEGEDVLSQGLKERLQHLVSMIELVRENQSKQRWKNLKREIKKTSKLAEREVRRHQDEKWKAFEERNPAQHVESYTEFDEPSEAESQGHHQNQSTSGATAASAVKPFRRSWFQIVDLPDENNEQEVLLKQQYESAWLEVQRFSSALLAFYLLCYFAGYYLMRSGVDAHFMSRIYDTILFKQLTLGLFVFTVLVNFRISYLKGRIVSDAAIAAVIILGLSLIFV